MQKQNTATLWRARAADQRVANGQMVVSALGRDLEAVRADLPAELEEAFRATADEVIRALDHQEAEIARLCQLAEDVAANAAAIVVADRKLASIDAELAECESDSPRLLKLRDEAYRAAHECTRLARTKAKLEANAHPRENDFARRVMLGRQEPNRETDALASLYKNYGWAHVESVAREQGAAATDQLRLVLWFIGERQALAGFEAPGGDIVRSVEELAEVFRTRREVALQKLAARQGGNNG